MTRIISCSCKVLKDGRLKLAYVMESKLGQIYKKSEIV
jgi:hypothetical protein